MTRAEAAEGKKIDKLDFIKIKTSCTSKDTIKRVKRQPTELKQTFANHISDKELISQICKSSITTTTKNTTQFKNGQRTCVDISLKKIYNGQ